MEFTPIGIIYTPFQNIQNMPIQPAAAQGVEGKIELLPEFQPGLKDLIKFSHITLLYHLHMVRDFNLEVTPFLDDKPHGIFATRSPKRPNPIGLSTVRLKDIKGSILYIEDVDMLTESPLLDIKPFFPHFDNRENVRFGWLEERPDVDVTNLRSDDRFS